MTESYKTDVAIIGAGPVGLFAIFECGMMKLSCHVIDVLPEIGGQCTALYPEKPIYDIPGCPEILAGDLIENLERQAVPFDPVYHLGHEVMEVEKQDDGWCLTTNKGVTIKAKAVIIAGGGGAFGPNRPPLEGLEDYEESSVFYMVRRRQDFAGKRIVIAGGGDSAIDWTLSLSGVAERVMLVHRRDKFRAAPENVAKIHKMADSGQIDLVVPYQLDGLEGENGRLSGVRVRSMEGEDKLLKAEILLPFYGLASHLGPIIEWELELDHHHIIIDPATARTSQAGIYAIGDIAAYENKIKLILTGFAEAAQAAQDIYKLVYPDQVLHFEYSTTKGLPSAKSACR